MSKTSKRKNRQQRRREREKSRQVESRVIDHEETDARSAGETEGDYSNEKDTALSRSDEQRPEAYVRPGLMQRLFSSGRSGEADEDAMVHYDRRPGLLRPFARRNYQREMALASIREGFEDLSDLMSDIRDGLGASVERQGELLEQLKYLPIVAEQNVKAAERFETQYREANRLQGEAVRALRDQASGQREQNDQLNRVLGTINKESRDQKRDIDEFQARLDRMRQSDQAIADNLSTVSHAVRKVSEQGAVQGEFSMRMQAAFDERTRQLEESMKKQASRQGLILTIALLLAFIAVAAVAVVGFLYLRQTGAIS